MDRQTANNRGPLPTSRVFSCRDCECFVAAYKRGLADQVFNPASSCVYLDHRIVRWPRSAAECGIITREVEATHCLRRRIIVTSGNCIAIETDAIRVLLHRNFTPIIHSKSNNATQAGPKPAMATVITAVVAFSASRRIGSFSTQYNNALSTHWLPMSYHRYINNDRWPARPGSGNWLICRAQMGPEPGRWAVRFGADGWAASRAAALAA